MKFPSALSFGPDGGMCAAYTDRAASFMHFHFETSQKSYGLMYNDIELIKDFCFIDNSQQIITRDDCIKMTARCGSLEFVYLSFSLFITLLFTGKPFPQLYIRYVPTSQQHKNVPALFVLITGPRAILNKKDKKFQTKSPLIDADIFSIPVDTLQQQSWNLLFTINDDSRFFITQEKASSVLMHAHRAHIEQFFSSFSFSVSSGKKQDNADNAVFSSSLLWALFSGWMMVTGIEHRGIWAGLPWFRDNWGRDTFIALPGILLVSGQFEEARNVISSFAEYQNKDSTSVSYGKIPNRYRDADDVIYNTADGTLWFIREVWEYVQYTIDIDFLQKIFPVVQLALEADRTLRTDAHGFLTHDDADTWMDARIENKEPWSPRGNRACDIQALWYTALIIGASMASLCGHEKYQFLWEKTAQKVKENFSIFFIDQETESFADCVHNDDSKDMSLRPNQLFCITVPNIPGFSREQKQFVGTSIMEKSAYTVFEKLAFPYGVLSLDQKHENFHPYHDSSTMYHKDAAYHNGTIWLWNSGPLVEAMCLHHEQESVYDLSLSHAKLMQPAFSNPFTGGCAGQLSENMDAYLSDGKVHLSGTFSQAWSVSEFARTAFVSYAGIRPCLLQNKIIISPALPSNWKEGQVSFRVEYELLHLSWYTTEETNEIHFEISRKKNGRGTLSALKICVLLAETNESSVIEKEYTLKPEKSCSFSGYIIRKDKRLFAIPLNDTKQEKEKIPSIRMENYLHQKIKGKKI